MKKPFALLAVVLLIAGTATIYLWKQDILQIQQLDDLFGKGEAQTRSLGNNGRIAGISRGIRISSKIKRVKQNKNDKSITVDYQYEIKNSGNIPVRKIKAKNQLAKTFKQYNYKVTHVSCSKLKIDNKFDGDIEDNLLEGDETLEANESAVIDIQVQLFPGDELGTFENQLEIQGTTAEELDTETIPESSPVSSEPEEEDDGEVQADEDIVTDSTSISFNLTVTGDPAEEASDTTPIAATPEPPKVEAVEDNNGDIEAVQVGSVQGTNTYLFEVFGGASDTDERQGRILAATGFDLRYSYLYGFLALGAVAILSRLRVSDANSKKD